MDNKAKLTLRQTHRLVMTPMLQQAIKLLPLARFELITLINQEMTENPFLEEEPIQPSDTDNENNSSGEYLDTEYAKEESGENQNPIEIDWDTFFEENYYQGPSFEDYAPAKPSIENTIKQKTSLREHLIWQLNLSTEDAGWKYIGAIIIGNIDDDGYLRSTVEEIVQNTGANTETVEKVLELIQSFDPVGVGARDIKECLMLQIKNKALIDSLAAVLIEKYLEELEDRNFKRIADKINIPIEELLTAVKIIRELNPSPGNGYTSAEIQYISPDVIVVKTADDYQVVINDEGIPRLRISRRYNEILNSKNKAEAKEYIENKFRAALWFIKSIEQRRQTIYKVANSIVKFQREFLDKGLTHLKPLILKDVASDISMHESTVSRVTTNKYMYTPMGMFELKFFFHSGISSSEGDAMSSIRVKEMLKEIISQESSRKPFTDQHLVNALKNNGVNIARRTITKYRKEIKIPSACRRKKRFDY